MLFIDMGKSWRLFQRIDSTGQNLVSSLPVADCWIPQAKIGSGLLDSTGQNLVSSLPVFNIAFIESESDFLF
jgi:hypothetical protein